MARGLTRSKRKLSVTPRCCRDRRLVHRPSGADSLVGEPMRRRTALSRSYGYHSCWLACLSIWLFVGQSLIPVGATAQTMGQYRAFWVDTFNTPLNNHGDIVAVVNTARSFNANAIFAQVRRRGDSWYLNSLEPPPDFVPVSSGFDPLQDLINEAHAHGIEVHAFVIIGAVWNKNPILPPSATQGPPRNPSHGFNLHGGYDPATMKIVQGPDNWLTRTLLPDGTNGVSFQGHRIGADFWLDLGHPDAAAYTVDVLLHLVRNY